MKATIQCVGLILLLSPLVGVPLAAQDLSEGLVGYWPFDETVDESVAGRETLVLGDGTSEEPAFVFGKFGKAMRFDGRSRFLEVVPLGPGEFNFEGSGFTVTGWFLSGERSPNFDSAPPIVVGTGGTAGWRIQQPGAHEFRASFHGLREGRTIYGDLARSLATPDRPGGRIPRWRFVSLTFDPAKASLQVRVDGRRLGADVPADAIDALSPAVSGLFVGGHRDPNEGALWRGVLDDFAIWSRVLSNNEVASIYNKGAGRPLSELLDPADEDGDGLPDPWERAHGLDPSRDDSEDDQDGDTLTNETEFALRTHPANRDTDGDGLPDSVETNDGNWTSAEQTGTDPGNPDSDGDGLLDSIESNSGSFLGAQDSGSDPNRKDTDLDGYDDGREIALQSDPNEKAPPIEGGLVANWTFDGHLEDIIDRNHGANRGAKPPVLSEGRFGEALRVASEDDMVSIHQNLTLPGWHEGRYSISLWYKREGRTSGPKVLLGTDIDKGWRLELTPNQVKFSYKWLAPDSPSVLSINLRFQVTPRTSESGWHHVALAVDPDTVLLSVDGNRRYLSQDPFHLNEANAPLSIGGIPAAPVDHFDGLIDDVAVWTRALTRDEMTSIFESGKPIQETRAGRWQPRSGRRWSTGLVGREEWNGAKPCRCY